MKAYRILLLNNELFTCIELHELIIGDVRFRWDSTSKYLLSIDLTADDLLSAKAKGIELINDLDLKRT